MGEKRKMHPAEVIFMRELELLNEEERITRIVDRFGFYSHDIKELDPDETDQALLWLLDLLLLAFLKRKEEFSNRYGSLDICLRKIYHNLPIQYDKKYLFPETKKKMLRVILEKWDDHKCDKDNQRILIFIWDMYSADRPPEEKNIIDVLIKERLNNVNLEDIEQWITWLEYGSLAKDEYSNAKKPKDIPINLRRRFILARARKSSFNEVVQDIRNEKIVEMLGLKNAGDDVVSVLKNVCKPQLELYREVAYCARYINKNLRIYNEENVRFLFKGVDDIDIYIRDEIMPNLPLNQKQHCESLYKDAIEAMKKNGLLDYKEKAFFMGREIVLSLRIDYGAETIEKKWDARN